MSKDTTTLLAEFAKSIKNKKPSNTKTSDSYLLIMKLLLECWDNLRIVCLNAKKDLSDARFKECNNITKNLESLILKLIVDFIDRIKLSLQEEFI